MVYLKIPLSFVVTEESKKLLLKQLRQDRRVPSWATSTKDYENAVLVEDQDKKEVK
ncbi:MAG TPA: hypothetical protein VHK27_05465 [Gammaproteobacteria bacterium]|nr:hypothetical protein [Gammaproteobacteria bacterium]